MRLTLHPDAEKDLFEAAAFYEREGSAALAARFLAEFKRAAALLVAQPELGAPRAQGRRGLTLRVFPYTLVYHLSAEEITVLVLKHERRRPGFGSRRS